jgi:heptaprenyl diphosphate synthase
MSSLIYSLSGAISSTLVMGFAVKYFEKVFSLVGVSILGSITHNFAQVTVASVILSTFGIYSYLPFLMVVGLLTGGFTGLAANFAKEKLSGSVGLMETVDRRR